MKEWDLAHKNVGGQWSPSEGIVKFCARHIKRRMGIEKYQSKNNYSKVLDLGCGNGRHLIFFAEQGFDVTGIDISREAIEIAGAWINKKGLNAELIVGDVKSLPFDENSFDLIISYGVLDHIPFSDAVVAIDEIKRVLSNNGMLFLTLRSTTDSEFGRGEKVGKNTYVLEKGYEKGIIQHYFDFDEIKDLFEDFNIYDIELHDEKFPDSFGVDKAFLQSSGKSEKHLDLNKIDFSLRYSRWFIAGKIK